jgi:hypothetical protein
MGLERTFIDLKVLMRYQRAIPLREYRNYLYETVPTCLLHFQTLGKTSQTQISDVMSVSYTMPFINHSTKTRGLPLSYSYTTLARNAMLRLSGYYDCCCRSHDGGKHGDAAPLSSQGRSSNTHGRTPASSHCAISRHLPLRNM